MSTDFLYLSEPDMIKAGVLDAGRCVDVCEEVFSLLGTGDYLMGGPSHNSHGLVLMFPKSSPFPGMPLEGPERRFIAMPAYLGGRFHVCGEKWYGSNVENVHSRNLPRSILMITLNDPDSCAPLAYMSGNLVSAMRTGAIPGVAVRHAANQDAKTIALIGGGPIQKATLMAMKAELPGLSEVRVMTAHRASAQKFLAWCETQGMSGIATSLEEDDRALEKTILDSDIVSIAASPKKPIFVEDKWIKEGATVLLTSPIEADDDFWLNNQVIYDNIRMHETYFEEAMSLGGPEKAVNGWGKMYRLIADGRMTALKDAFNMGTVVSEHQTVRTDKRQKVVFVTSGMVVFDVGWSCDIYHNAIKKGIGTRLHLWEKPYWS